MISLKDKITIDWNWVESNVSVREKIKDIRSGTTKHSVQESLKKAIDIAMERAKPIVAVSEHKITSLAEPAVLLECGVSISSSELSKHIKGADKLAAFIVSIGNGVEDAASEYMGSHDELLGYLLDRVGSFSVESLAKRAEEALREIFAADGLGVSMRFSPGYCDWPIEEQFKLAKLIDFTSAGVSLNESCVMLPKKSISAVVGIGPKDLFNKIKSPCASCNMKICSYKRND